MSHAMKTRLEKVSSQFLSLLNTKREQIYDEWMKLLSNEYGHRAERKLAIVLEEKERGQDLFTLLHDLLLDKNHDADVIAGMISKVRLSHYSICDLYTEFFCIEAAFARTLRSIDTIDGDIVARDVRSIHRRVGHLFAKILKETAMSYEYVIENAKTGVVLTDNEGLVTYANTEFARLVGDSPTVGTLLSNYFRGEDRFIIQNILTNPKSKNYGKLRMDMYDSNGRQMPAGVEFGKCIIDEQHQGGYAHITDISLPIRWQQKVLDEFPYGVVRINRSGEVKYANPSMLYMVGKEDWPEKPFQIWEILPDDKHIVEQFISRLEERFSTGQSANYTMSIKRFTDDRQIPISVTAIAETDLTEEENVVASFAIVRSLISEKMVKDIERIKDEKKLLATVAEKTSLLVPFDLFSVWQYGKNANCVKLLFENVASAETQSNRRWWNLLPEQIAWLQQIFKNETAYIGGIDEFIAIEPWENLRDDPFTQRYLEAGYQNFLIFPVVAKDQIQAVICLTSKRPNFFKEWHVKFLKDLPIDMAVRVALERRKLRNARFRQNLIADISAQEDINKTGKLIVDGLESHFPWKSVSLFRVNPEGNDIELISQAPDNLIDESDFPQSIEDGILGHVYRTGEAVNIDNIQTHPLGIRYREILPSTRSELCLPLKLGEVTWLLNIEDTDENAFSIDEQKMVEWILSGLASALDRIWHHSFLEEALKVMSDAVLVTNTNGQIRQVNSAAEILLSSSQSELRGRFLQDFIINNGSPSISISDLLGQKEFSMQTHNGQTIPVMLSGTPLEKEFAALIFVAKNMFYHKRLEELEYLDDMYFEIATQVQTPLSLVYNWLSQLQDFADTPFMIDIVDKCLRHLQKVELTYKRLAMFKAGQRLGELNPLLLDISEIMSVIRDDMPAAEIQKIEWPEEEKLYLDGDLFQLVFCYETILSYLLRFVAKDDRVRIDLQADEGWLKTTISAGFPKLKTQGTINKKYKVAKTLKDMALGEGLIENFITQNGGRYYHPTYIENRLSFRFDLPQSGGMTL